MSEAHRTNRGGSLKYALDRFDDFQYAIQRLERTLYPDFQENVWVDSPTEKGGPYVQFPDLCLAVQQSSLVYESVFPHYSEERAFTIDHYLTSLEEETDWNDRSMQSELRVADRSTHGVLKNYILANSAELFGPEWEFYRDEKPVRSPTESSTGRADLVFHNGSKQLMVEVKTDREDVNEAFGQLRSYVIRDGGWYSVDEEDIEMVIAAPQFHKYHHTMAEEWGFTLRELSA
jgi:hypothetical protein